MPESGANNRLREFFGEHPEEMVFADIQSVPGEPEPNIWLPPESSIKFAHWMEAKGYAQPGFEETIRGWVREWKESR